MADPLSTSEIEDVLTSIRRLVAEDREARPQTARPIGRLILTPALRVDDTAELVSYPAHTESVASATPPPFQISHEVYDRLAPIDEEVLHDLVRELVTEELQGPLGENITRNIRKMVRAEIARALTARNIP